MGESMESAVPVAVLEPLKETQKCMGELSGHLLQLLEMAEPDVVANLPPLQRAGAFLVLAKSATALLSVRLRCGGICPDDHPIKSEIERLGMYQRKFEKFNDWSKAPLRPSTTINNRAAARFIQHSLPDLTPEQREGMRKISRGEAAETRLSDNRKRKYHSTEVQSVRAAAQEFLEKAARELLGSSGSGVKGPLRVETSDEDDEPMS